MGNAKDKARKAYLINPKITKMDLEDIIGDEVLDSTIEKYLIEFRATLAPARDTAPDTISMAHLEKELAYQLENNPNSSVIKSCIDFLKLKQMSDDNSEEIDMEQFIKKGKDLYI